MVKHAPYLSKASTAGVGGSKFDFLIHKRYRIGIPEVTEEVEVCCFGMSEECYS